ncbi:hypothetical protein NP233_g3142 [Leucocoprinus birnbaumii]|uniref:Peptidase A1 domain-containing protein n=1 Tax=Leucocoprinus birnbaumii TaxID=56174 RepID=A0AAD5VZM5_9AGAR|nr:hypothetical protein NP233_g3142 [Leucocoprinus birnbaumii]
MVVAGCWMKSWLLLHSVLNTAVAYHRPSSPDDPPVGRGRGVHLPLIRAPNSVSMERREESGSARLGNYLDLVMVEINGIATPVLIDTGSSDLWVVSDACTTGCDDASGIPLIPHSVVNSTGIDVSLLYGDSGTGTYAYGIIGNGNVDLAELRVSAQQFAMINRTNADVIESGSSGILGLGFPINSVLWNTIFVDQYLHSNPSEQSDTLSLTPRQPPRSHQRHSFPRSGLRHSHFPDLSFSDAEIAHTDQHSARATDSLSDLVFRSYGDIAPFLGRLIATKEIDPIFAVTLQRDTVDIGGNIGQLSIGGFPPGVQNDSFTWVPVRGYTRNQGGLPAPVDSPGETYPIAWEIPVDDVYLDGKILPRSNLSSSSISLSALIDTGNSLIRGPEDVVGEIDRRIGSSFPCSEPHTLAFSIGGKLFPVDPRDFLFQEYTNSVSICNANVVATDPPAVGGYLFSWSLGTPFLKSVMSAFYYGDLQYPSRDPPRVGLMSTVPQDASERLQIAIKSANSGDGSFPYSSEPAPATHTSSTQNAKIPEPTESAISTPTLGEGQISWATKNSMHNWDVL